MKFEELKKTFWEASYVLKEHESTCCILQNAFTKDFPLCSLFVCEAMQQLKIALMFVNTTLAYRTSGEGHKILMKLHGLILQGMKDYTTACKGLAQQDTSEAEFV